MSKRKPLPYAAAGLIDDALFSASKVARANLRATESSVDEVEWMRQHVIIAVEIEKVVKRLTEVKGIRDES